VLHSFETIDKKNILNEAMNDTIKQRTGMISLLFVLSFVYSHNNSYQGVVAWVQQSSPSTVPSKRTSWNSVNSNRYHHASIDTSLLLQRHQQNQPTMYIDSASINTKKHIPKISTITPNRIPFVTYNNQKYSSSYTPPLPSNTILQPHPLPPQRTTTTTASNHLLLSQQQTHGMPWKQSISKQYNESSLFYMPFYEWQMSFMQQHLTNLQILPVLSKKGQDMSYIENKNGTIRMHTAIYRSDEYKYIRCTTLDGGHQSQVYTSVWYPTNTYVPVLGIDLLQFNHGKKHLCIVDFQPILESNHRNSNNENINYESVLKPIRDQYPSLHGEMTNRFYNANDIYFSKQMLLGRHNAIGNNNNKTQNDVPSYTAQQMVYNDLYPAYQQYVQTHVQIQKQSLQNQNHHHNIQHQQQQHVQQCHIQYDTYSAKHDPAHTLLSHLFGSEWADTYVYDILFPSSIQQRPE
jgi:hypothetical protein